jgi:hypothetical protein
MKFTGIHKLVAEYNPIGKINVGRWEDQLQVELLLQAVTLWQYKSRIFLNLLWPLLERLDVAGSELWSGPTAYCWRHSSCSCCVLQRAEGTLLQAMPSVVNQTEVYAVCSTDLRLRQLRWFEKNHRCFLSPRFLLDIRIRNYAVSH